MNIKNSHYYTTAVVVSVTQIYMVVLFHFNAILGWYRFNQAIFLKYVSLYTKYLMSTPIYNIE